ncbi:MAG TPA: hypothetical protein DGH68_05320 [Bacteroidetes bacterium]|jgi:hypothetical protein|nr:hypothetical protein [Bacteroidota bacterium]
MFNLRLTTKRELALLNATIGGMRDEISNLRVLVEHERKRAEAAINLLLMRTQKAVIDVEPSPLTLEQENNVKEAALNIFGDDYSEQELMEKLQHDR